MIKGASAIALKKARLAPLATLVFSLLAACGGDDSGGGSSPTPTPTVAPTPSPSPAPSQTPTPSASYPSIVDFSKDLFGQSPVAELTYVSVYDVNATLPDPFYVYKSASSRLLDSPSAGVFTWDPAKKEATARVGEFFHSFPGTVGERPPSWNELESYANGADERYLFRWIGLRGDFFAKIDLEFAPRCTYPPGEPANCTVVNRYAHVGPRTLPGELRLTGSDTITSVASFKIARREKPTQVEGSATIPLSIDYAAKTVMAQFSSDGQTFILQGQYRPDQNTRLAGTIRSVDGQYAGQFAGDFYGPGGKNVALVYSAQGDGRGMAGRLIASW